MHNSTTCRGSLPFIITIKILKLIDLYYNWHFIFVVPYGYLTVILHRAAEKVILVALNFALTCPKDCRLSLPDIVGKEFNPSRPAEYMRKIHN